MDIGILLVAFFSFVSGLLVRGINININHTNKRDEAPEEYNESTTDRLDPDVRLYYEQNNGLNKF